MSYIVNLAKGLTNENFNIITGLCSSQNITEHTRFLTFAKREGHINYGIAIINCDIESDYKQAAGLLSDSFSNIEGNKIFINIFLSSNIDDELISYVHNDIDNYNSNFINIKWLVNAEENKFIVEGSQPDDILNLKKLIKDSFDFNNSTSVGISELREQANNIEISLIKCNIPVITYILMALNFVFWIIMYTDFGVKVIDDMSLNKMMVSDGQIYRLFTYMFTHGGIGHFVCNTFTLFIIGTRVERFSGHIKFMILYILSGIAAGCTSYVVEPLGVAVGASGAIFGIIGGMIYLVKRLKHNIGGFDYSVTIVYAIIGIASGFMIANVDNFAHIGGLISGLIISMIIRLDK